MEEIPTKTNKSTFLDWQGWKNENNSVISVDGKPPSYG